MKESNSSGSGYSLPVVELSRYPRCLDEDEHAQDDLSAEDCAKLNAMVDAMDDIAMPIIVKISGDKSWAPCVMSGTFPSTNYIQYTALIFNNSVDLGILECVLTGNLENGSWFFYYNWT